MQINVTKRDGTIEPLDIEKIREYTKGSVEGLDGVSLSELELDGKIQFFDGISTSDIQKILIQTYSALFDFYIGVWNKI